MTFDIAADALIDVIRKSSRYTQVNSSKYSYAVLGGGGRRAVVVNFGGSAGPRNANASGRRIASHWIAQIELYVRHTTRDKIGEDVVEEYTHLMNHIDAYPTLDTGGTPVTTALVVAVSEVARDVDARGNVTSWMLVTLDCNITEVQTITNLEPGG